MGRRRSSQILLTSRDVARRPATSLSNLASTDGSAASAETSAESHTKGNTKEEFGSLKFKVLTRALLTSLLYLSIEHFISSMRLLTNITSARNTPTQACT